MKTLILVVGPNGVGKSTTCTRLHQRLPNSCRIESEWCRNINPFDLTPETERLTESNLSVLLRNYLKCSLVSYVILSYGLHGPRRRILEKALANLGDIDFRLLTITLTCSEEENARRMAQDGRDADRIQRALQQTRRIYEGVGNTTIDTTHLTVNETVDQILSILSKAEAKDPA